MTDDEKVVDRLEVSNEAKEWLWQKGWVSQWGGRTVGMAAWKWRFG